MNGPQHYRRAERLLESAQGATLDDGHAQYLVAQAQVHATLAFVAVTAEGAEVVQDSPLTGPNDWAKAVLS